MRITVKLFANLRNFLPNGQGTNSSVMDIGEGATVSEVLERLKVPRDMAHLTLINGKQSKAGAVLSEGDLLSVFPPLAGGA